MRTELMNRIVFALLLSTLAASVATTAPAADFTATGEKITAAMASSIRGPDDIARDLERLPLQTLEFSGLRDDMKIIELMPGGGWYTKLLAQVMAQKGELYEALGTARVKETLAGKPGFEKMKFVAEDAKVYRPEGSTVNVLELGTSGLGVTDADMVLTFRNYHNFGAEGRAVLNKAVYDALKPGGIYFIKDHTRRHMEADNPENRRRVDPVLVIKEVQAAGFELVDYSPLHARADDELRYEVGRKTVTGNTDRFTLKFVKP